MFAPEFCCGLPFFWATSRHIWVIPRRLDINKDYILRAYQNLQNKIFLKRIYLSNEFLDIFSYEAVCWGMVF